LSAALLAPYGAHPFFSTGYYKLVAASIQWLHICAGLGAIFLIAGILTSPRRVWPAVLNPATILISAFAILTAISMIHADHAGLVLFGSPQSGKGVIWFLDAAIFVALAYIIRDNKPAIAIVFFAALLATTPIVAQQIYNTHIRQTDFLLRGGDSYAYLGLLLPFLALMLEPGLLRRCGAAVAWLVAVSLVAVSGNKAAAGIFIVLVFVYCLTHFKPALVSWFRKIKIWLAALSLIRVHPIIMIVTLIVVLILLALPVRFAPVERIVLKASDIVRDSGFAYYAKLDVKDKFPYKFIVKNNSQSLNYKLRLLENGVVLAPSQVENDVIRNIGSGSSAYAPGGFLMFSASDNSNPRTNGKSYVAFIQAEISWLVSRWITIANFIVIGAIVLITWRSGARKLWEKLGISFIRMPGKLLRKTWRCDPLLKQIIFSIAFSLTHLKFALLPWFRKINFWFTYLLIIVGVLAVWYFVISIDFRGDFGSVDSRLLIAKIGIAAQMEASLLEWAIGHGWGHTQGAFYQNLTESGASLLDNRWDFLWRDIFHSHNIAQELIFEIGISGFAAFCALLAALIAYSAPTKRTIAAIFVTGYLLINSVWFEFAHTVPMLALTVFAIMSSRYANVQMRKVKRAFGLLMVTSVAISCVVASIALYQFDSQVKSFKMEGGNLTGKDYILARTDYPTEHFPIDPRGDDFIRAAVYREIIRSINADQQTNTGYITPLNVVLAILDDIENRLASTNDPELILVGLVIFNDAYFDQNRSWLRPILVNRDQLWHRLANRHLNLAPKRTDVLVVYLSWLVTNDHFHQATKLVETITRFDVDDPVGLYFKGVIKTANPSPAIKEQGLRYIARAIDQGVERFLIVPGWLKSWR